MYILILISGVLLGVSESGGLKDMLGPNKLGDRKIGMVRKLYSLPDVSTYG